MPQHICAVCLEDYTGRPVMMDRVSGDVFCPAHAEHQSEMMRDVNVGRCKNCGFRYYTGATSKVGVACPKCAKPLQG